MTAQHTYRTIWISDVHLGSKNCKAEFLIDFLKHNHCEQLYLVGDIIDGWKMRAKLHWPQSHLNVVKRILDKARGGVDVIYLTGNHDEFLRSFMEYDLNMGNLRILNEIVHETADKRKLLVVHGDQYDAVLHYQRWMAYFGDFLYSFLMWINRHFNLVRKWFGYGYWSLSAYVKSRVKKAVNIISKFEDLLVKECDEKGLDGVVCGHIHTAELKDMQGKLYANSGDWVESCTALVEHDDGKLEIVHWAKITPVKSL